MTDAGDDIVSLGTRIGAGIPPAPRMGSGSISSSVSGVTGIRNVSYASVAGARQGRLTQVQALEQARSKSQVSGPSAAVRKPSQRMLALQI